MAVADDPPLVNDVRRGTCDPLLGMEHAEKFDDSPLRVGYETEFHIKLTERLMNRQGIVRADSDDLGVGLGDLFRILLELNQLPLTIASEVTPIEDHEEVLFPFEGLGVKSLNLKLGGLFSHFHGSRGGDNTGCHPPSENNEQNESERKPFPDPIILLHPELNS